MRLLVLVLVVGVAAVAGIGARGGTSPRRTPRTVTGTLCLRRRRGPLDYGWPVLPFGAQHPIRGGFGDPRTVSLEKLGLDDSGDPGDYSFHNGIDISAHEWTVIYPVVSGRVRVIGTDELVVHASRRRTFQYFHLMPLVVTGEQVVADVTPLGVIRSARHVHLSEIDRGKVVNPLLHIRPYDDGTVPVLRDLRIVDRRGRLSMTVEAADPAPLPVPGVWDGLPLAPALVRSTLTRNGRVVWQRVAADFRASEPPKQDFWRVYGDGTYQNFPVFAGHYYWRLAGRYVFRLTGKPVALPGGRYVVHVAAADECGNEAALTQSVRVQVT